MERDGDDPRPDDPDMVRSQTMPEAGTSSPIALDDPHHFTPFPPRRNTTSALSFREPIIVHHDEDDDEDGDSDDESEDDDSSSRSSSDNDFEHMHAPTTSASPTTATATTQPTLRKRKYRSRYDDFSTIDWIHDFSIDRKRAARLNRNATRVPDWLLPGSVLYGLFPRVLSREAVTVRARRWSASARTMWDAAQGWLLVMAVGVCVGVINPFVEVATSWLSDIKSGYCGIAPNNGNSTTAVNSGFSGGSGWYLNRKFCCWEQPNAADCPHWHTWSSLEPFNFLVYTAFALSMATASFHLVQRFAPYAASSGLPEVRTILGGFVIHKFLGGWTLVVKTLAVIVSVGAGLSLGSDAPMVHIACCVGNILPRLFRKFRNNEAKKREIMSAAAAAGISVAFGAPLAGVLFSLEEASTYFPQKTLWRSFFCSIVAAFVLQAINPFRSGELVLFQTTYTRDWHAFEVVCFAMLGVIGGTYGVIFIRLNRRLAILRRSHPFWVGTTGDGARWADWFAWVRGSFLETMYRGLMQRLRRPRNATALNDDTSGNASETRSPTAAQPLPPLDTTPYTAAASRRWWNLSGGALRRCFQELIFISLLTSVVSYGNPFMAGDMATLLGAVLKECKNDAALVGRQNPNVPTVEPGTPLPPGRPMPSPSPGNFTSLLNDTINHHLGYILLPRTPTWLGTFVGNTTTTIPVIEEDNDTFGLCYNSSDEAYSYNGVLTMLFITAVARMGLTCLTFGLRVPGGVYLPTMVVGACFGRMVGIVVRTLVERAQSMTLPPSFLASDANGALSASSIIITPGTYALVGAAAFLGGVTKLTVTIVVMMFEVTGGGALTYLVPLMIALMSAKFVGDALDRERLGGLTDMYIRFHGYPLLDLKRDWNFFNVKKVSATAMAAGGSLTTSPAVLSPTTRVVGRVDASAGGEAPNVLVCETILSDRVMAPLDRLTTIAVFESVQLGANGVLQARPFPHTVASMRRLISNHPYQGFPLVLCADSPRPAGYIRRADIHMVLERARRTYGIDDEAPCYFFGGTFPLDTTTPSGGAATSQHAILIDVPSFGRPSSRRPSSAASSRSHTRFALNQAITSSAASIISESGRDPLADAETAGSQLQTHINFTPWIDITPTSIQMNYPLDMTLDLFKKLGLRYVLVVHRVSVQRQQRVDDDDDDSDDVAPPGELAGIITKKDLLRFMDRWSMAQARGRGDAVDDHLFSPSLAALSSIEEVHAASSQEQLRRQTMPSGLNTVSPTTALSAAARFSRSQLSVQARSTPGDDADDAFVDVFGNPHPFTTSTPRR